MMMPVAGVKSGCTAHAPILHHRLVSSSNYYLWICDHASSLGFKNDMDLSMLQLSATADSTIKGCLQLKPANIKSCDA
jgi:hypothetical protein